ncbi:kinesin-like nuclear fusion protein [Mortierella alpina]|uniref:Kinesin-like protein n=1 Tax=Mortierella alpina TaxID=64518 RepID=A0A9P6M1R9_MORAP|nr:kinesin-like nuclear fusion protein [Mortierella alpina]
MSENTSQPTTGAPEQLNRSISKLKPPTKITSSSSASSAVATALAVAAAYENNQTSLTNASGTLVGPKATNTAAGVKREAEDAASNNRAKRLAAGTRPVPTARVSGPPARRPAGSAAPSTQGAPRTRLGAPSREPLNRPTSRGATAARTTSTISRQPAPTRTSSAMGPARGLGKVAVTTTRTKAPTQQPSPAPSESSVTSESKTREAQDATIQRAPALVAKKKRPAWDTKGRLADMEELTTALHDQLQTSTTSMTDLTSKLESSESKITELESFRKTLEGKVAIKETENKDILQKMQFSIAKQHSDEIQSLRSQHTEEMEQFRRTQTRLKQETDELQTRLQSTKTQLQTQIQENTSLRSTISTQSSTCLALEGDNRALKLQIERTEGTLAHRVSTIESLERQLSESEVLVKALEQRIREEETIRRRLHNTIQELKGNIRVFCRVRPVSSSESASKAETTTALIKYPGQEGREIEFSNSTESARGSQIEKVYPFTFDKVFQPSSKQEDVFEEISQLVQSALDGYNVCIFAYGQTGSGKTHTMEGPLNASRESMGMIPRSVLQIYETAKALESKGWSYTMEGQYVEIYNESINDLLGSDGLDTTRKHEIRHGPNGKTTITDITTVVLTSPEKVAALLKKAAHNRSVGSTQMNERSSRSHCVFTLRLAGKNSITDESSEGVLNLIDLAGSERLSQSGATGDRLRETQAINKSLSCLGDVIYAIANKDPHVPYRNSKLTYLLQNSLGGNSKTLMFVNISPLMSNFNETLCSLRFATKVNSCTIGTATKRAVARSFTEKITNTANSYIGGAKQTVGETLGNNNLAANGAAQKAQAESAQRLADAKIHTEGVGHKVEGEAQAKIGSLTGDRSMQARGEANQALGDIQRNV